MYYIRPRVQHSTFNVQKQESQVPRPKLKFSLRLRSLANITQILVTRLFTLVCTHPWPTPKTLLVFKYSKAFPCPPFFLGSVAGLSALDCLALVYTSVGLASERWTLLNPRAYIIHLGSESSNGLVCCSRLSSFVLTPSFQTSIANKSFQRSTSCRLFFWT